MSSLRRPLTDAAASDDAPAADAATAFAAIQLNDFNDLDDDEADVRRRAYEMERRADEQWRSMHKEQRRRNEEAELKARPSAEQVASQAESRRQQALQQQAHERQQRALEEESSSSSVVRGDDETDASGWTPREQRGLQAALRTCPAKDFASAGARWRGVAAHSCLGAPPRNVCSAASSSPQPSRPTARRRWCAWRRTCCSRCSSG